MYWQTQYNTMNTTIQMYDAQADSIRIEDIASNDNNRIVLSRTKRNNEDDHYNQDLYIQSLHDDDGEACIDYVPEGANDMGWLGYFVSKNNHLKELYFREFDYMSIDIIKPFIRGVINNRSIYKLGFNNMDLMGGRIFTMLSPFFENSPILSHLTIHNCHLTDDGWRLLALAIGSSKHKSLESVSVQNTNTGMALVDIITALSMHPNLQMLYLIGNLIGANGCVALATLLRHSCSMLESLHLASNQIDDEGIDALVPVLKNYGSLNHLWLSSNPSITSRGWQKVASVLESPNSNLESLRIVDNGVEEESVTVFASALRSNCTLKTFSIRSSGESSLTEEGWESFSNLLCDTSSINATFLSNHTLQSLSSGPKNENLLRPLLKLNNQNKKYVAKRKILQHHNDFDMTPFFEWEFKVLPLMISWFEIASSITMLDSFEPIIGPRKLSSIYQFVRGMPLLYVETRIRKELEDIKSKESQIEEEQLLLRQEQLMLDLKLQRLEQLRQSVKDDKERLLEKLAR